MLDCGYEHHAAVVQWTMRGAERCGGAGEWATNYNVFEHYDGLYGNNGIDAHCKGDGSEDGGWGHAGYV